MSAYGYIPISEAIAIGHTASSRGVTSVTIGACASNENIIVEPLCEYEYTHAIAIGHSRGAIAIGHTATSRGASEPTVYMKLTTAEKERDRHSHTIKILMEKIRTLNASIFEWSDKLNEDMRTRGEPTDIQLDLLHQLQHVWPQMLLQVEEEQIKYPTIYVHVFAILCKFLFPDVIYGPYTKRVEDGHNGLYTLHEHQSQT